MKLGAAVAHAVDSAADLYFVSVQAGRRVAILEAATLTEVRSVTTPGPTDAILYLPKSHRVYVTHDDGADVWVIDPEAAKITDTVTIPGVPEVMVHDEKSDRIFLNIKDKDVVAVIDPKSNKVVARWPTARPGCRMAWPLTMPITACSSLAAMEF